MKLGYIKSLMLDSILLIYFRLSEWVSEQGLMSPPTQYRLSGRQFYRSKHPTNSIKALKEEHGAD